MNESVKINVKSGSETISVLQITDTHLFSSETETLLGVRTAESFKAVLETIVNQGMPYDFIIVTGDISQDYTAESYQRFAHMIKLLDAPVFFVPGNHDDGPLMYSMFEPLGVNIARQVFCNNWQFILLNSQVYSVAHGWLERDEINFMYDCAMAHQDLHTAVCVHHLPHLVRSAWLDTQTMHNQEEFIAAIQACPNIRLVLSGHVHQEYDRTVNNIRYIASPSTSIQFEPFSCDFSLDSLGPGWRYLTFNSNGSIDTEVYRLPPERFVPDAGVRGY